jgi:transposase-like protein
MRQRFIRENTLKGARKDLSRAVYNRDLKIAIMRALDAGSSIGEMARKYQLSPKLLDRWRGEWRAKGESTFPGIGRRDAGGRMADLERKIGQLTMANDFLKRTLQRCADAGLKKSTKP